MQSIQTLGFSKFFIITQQRIAGSFLTYFFFGFTIKTHYKI